MKNYKKIISVIALLMCMTFIFTACSNNNGNKNQENNSSKIEQQTKPAKKTIKTIHGNEVEIPTEPKKVVALSGCGDLLALGIKPVAAMHHYAEGAFKEMSKDVKTLKTTTPYDIEEIMSYEPDLIIVYSGLEKEKTDELSKVAPVVPVLDQELSQEKRLKLIGEIFDVQDKVDNILKDYKKNLDDAKKKLADAGIADKTVSIYDYSNGAMTCFGNDIYYFNYIVYRELGLKAPKKVEDEILTDKSPQVEFSMKNLSMETLPEYTGDFVFMLTYDDDKISKELLDHTAWKALEPVKNNRVGTLDSTLFASNGILYSKEQFNKVVDQLLKAFA